MASEAIEFRNITKRYGDDARAPLVVNGISFTVPKGTLTTLLGPSKVVSVPGAIEKLTSFTASGASGLSP